MTEKRTGPGNYLEAQEHLNCADSETLGTAEEAAYLRYAQVHATNAQTAAIIALVDAYTDGNLYELDAWREVLPLPPLKKCRGQEIRRPECAERHTEDCTYADRAPEPKHVLLPVGTRVLVSDLVRDASTGEVVRKNPVAGRISGYDMHQSKYRWQYETSPGSYLTTESWAFVDNGVEVHPDGPECPPAPAPEPQEPTGPRIYVQNQRGKQGYVLHVAREDVRIVVMVKWLTPGTRPVWVEWDTLRVIPEGEVERCPNGQTGEECGSGENQCEPCLQAEDEEGDMIERSMGLR